jgi:hypothetical protein
MIMLQAVRYPYYANSGIGLVDWNCYDSHTGAQIPCTDTGTGTSWWDDWGSTIIAIIGASIIKIGDRYQTILDNKKIQEALAKATGGGSGAPTQATFDKLAQDLATLKGITLSQAKEILNNNGVNGGIPTPSTYPSWLLPAGIGLVLFVLLNRGKGGA